jgi:hypothetical protein
MAHPGSPRIDWEDLPAGVRADVEDALGSRVVHAETRDGGFSPGVAAVVTTVTGARAFVKSAGTSLNADTPRLHRREVEVMGALPAGLPAPVLLTAIDGDDWVTLVYEVVDGRLPHQPWVRGDLDRVLEAMVPLGEAHAHALEPFAARHAPLFSGWRSLADSGPPEELDGWSRRHLDRLVAMEPSWEAATEGTTVVHSDVRADNVLLADDAVTFVDWSHAARGAPWLDLLLMLPSVEVGGGPRPDEVWDHSPLAAGVDADAVDAVLVAVAGYFTHRATLPPVPGLPTIREFQAAQGVAARRWLGERRGWR